MRRWPTVRDEEFEFVVNLAEPQPGEVLIDVPSGGGYLGRHVPAGVQVIGIEVADPFVDRAHEHGAETVVSDLAGTALPPGTADVLVSVAGLHHEADHGALLAAWRRLLRPGGRLVAADVIEGSAQAEFLDGFVGPLTSMGHAGRYFGDDLLAIAQTAGLTDVRIVDGHYHWWASDEESLVDFCTSLFGIQPAGRDQVLDALTSGPGITREAGRVGLCWALRALVATSAG